MPHPAIVLLRGLTRRCPRCGRGRLFETWFKLPAACPRCGLILERGEGAFLGSLALNYAVTGLVFIAVLVVWLAIDLPDIHIFWLTVTCLAVGVVFPLIGYPFAKTTWAAVDLLLRGPEDRA